MSDLIDFHEPGPADRAWIKSAAWAGEARSAEFSYTNLCVWSPFYGTTVAEVAGRLVTRSEYDGGSYGWGTGPAERLEECLARLAADARARGVALDLWGLSAADCAWLAARRPGAFAFEPYPMWSDYCYRIGNLANLPGGKFQKKRNHVHAFEAAHPDWRVAPLTPSLIEDCRTVADAWEAEDDADGTRNANSAHGEAALRTALAHFADWRLDGLVLFAAEKPVAFSIGERLSAKFYDVLFEKAPRALRGAYPMINREFARFIAARYPDVEFLNREDAMGEAHLQKAKESYHPDLMVEKTLAVSVGGAAK